ncbi:phosphatase PAP2 family protein [Antrihabitans sp. YC2-6]|uniref:phosphatase PAP2 family protein n=1 Tax=Antrihabitans sp. YC2-6 TaxID=2799498 RepID=UPI0018F5AB09|nr:phosphatase PAP2 family protein [Antrihabitans sp. YC2-6]MBJ8348592.1 inositol phosphorylceramide synthase [Antrihabitans sp. YC2-6]
MTRRPSLLAMMVATSVLLLIAMQLFANSHDARGPILGLFDDMAGAPPSYSVPWGALIVAVVGLDRRARTITLLAALLIDVQTCVLQQIHGEAIDPGKGPLLVLPVLAAVVAFRWAGERRTLALRGIALGALLIMAWQLAAACLHATIVLRPFVLDEYALLADRALGFPSWVMYRIVHVAPIVQGAVSEVYSDLTFAAVFVVFWQLRNVVRDRVWPSHYLLRTFLVMGLIGPLFYFAFPVVGPVFAYGAEGVGSQVSNIWPTVFPTADTTPNPIPFNNYTARNCMPSMHTAWALSLFIHTRQGPWWLRSLGTFWLIVTCMATLGLGYHYGVDLIAGAVLCLTVEAALRDPERGWTWPRIKLVGAGSLLFVGLLASYRYLAVPIAAHPEFSTPLLLGSLAALWVAFNRGAARPYAVSESTNSVTAHRGSIPDPRPSR